MNFQLANWNIADNFYTHDSLNKTKERLKSHCIYAHHPNQTSMGSIMMLSESVTILGFVTLRF